MRMGVCTRARAPPRLPARLHTARCERAQVLLLASLRLFIPPHQPPTHPPMPSGTRQLGGALDAGVSWRTSAPSERAHPPCAAGPAKGKRLAGDGLAATATATTTMMVGRRVCLPPLPSADPSSDSSSDASADPSAETSSGPAARMVGTISLLEMSDDTIRLICAALHATPPFASGAGHLTAHSRTAEAAADPRSLHTPPPPLLALAASCRAARRVLEPLLCEWRSLALALASRGEMYAPSGARRLHSAVLVAATTSLPAAAICLSFPALVATAAAAATLSVMDAAISPQPEPVALLPRDGVAAVAHRLHARATTLSFERRPLGAAGGRALAHLLWASAPHYLRELGLKGCGLGDEGVAPLAEALRLGVLGALETLDLRANEIGDLGAIAVLGAVHARARLGGGARRRRPSSLRLLKLCDNPVGNGALDALLALVRGYPAALEELQLCGSALSHDAITCVRRAYQPDGRRSTTVSLY